MSDPFIAMLLRELIADPEAVETLRRLVAPEAASPAPPAYTTASLGRVTGLGEKAIRNAITNGELPARKRGGRWVITADDVTMWLGPPEQLSPPPPRARLRPRPLRSTFDGMEGWR